MIHPFFRALPAIPRDKLLCRPGFTSATAALLTGALALGGISSANPTFVVNAGAGADLVISRDANSTFDSESVPPSGAANIYAALNGGAFLNTGNTNASLAYSFTVNDGDVLSLHRNSWGVTAASVYGFDLRSGDGTTQLYNGAVNTGNANTGGVAGPTLAAGVPWEVTDPFEGSTWRLTFTAATADSADLVQGTAATPGAGPDRVDTITFTKVVPPDPQLRIATSYSYTGDATPMAIAIPFSNPGATQDLIIHSVTPGGVGAGAFVVDSFTNPVAPGGSGTINLTFTPSPAGTTSGTFTLASNAADQPSVVITVRVTTVDPAAVIAAASALWQRLAGDAASRFDFSMRPEVDGRDTYSLSVAGGRVKVKGSSGVAMARGAYDFLRTHGYGMIGWTGSRIALPAVLPDMAEVVVTPPGALQTYFNPVVFGYSTPYWDWKRWEHEIDLMAIHGINLPLALTAQEAIAERVWKRLGLTQPEIDAFLTGPAHLPWHRMGNIMNHDGSLPPSWHRDQVALQHQILGRMRELGIEPVVPAFAGFVPAAISRTNPTAALRQTLWNSGFPASKRPWFLLPTDPLFQQIAAMYAQEWRDEFGPATYFLADSFNEMDVPTGGRTLSEVLADYGEAIYGTLRDANPDAVWFIQGWMFGYQRDIWNSGTVAALLSRLPDNNVVVQDIACDYNALFWNNGMNWQLFNAFNGKRWTHGVIPNMGGKVAPTGVMSFYAANAPQTYANPASGRLSGAGYAGEGIENNEVLFELTTDAAWSSDPIDTDTWIRNYCISRYGACPPAMEQAWSLLRQTVYGTFTDHPRFGWQGGSPSLGTVNRDNRIQQAVSGFLSCRNELGSSSLYQADAIEFTAVALGLQAEQRFQLARDAFNASAGSSGEVLLAQGLRLLDELDRLLESHPLLRLDRWLGFANGHGDTPAETAAYQSNARRIITSWGPPVNDYSCRLWSGLVRDFYRPRMAAWFQAFRANQSFNSNAWEQNWISSAGISTVTPYADPVASAASLLAFAINESSPSVQPGEESLGDWMPGQMQTTWTNLEWSMTTDQLRRFDGVLFKYLSGSHRLEIQRVEIVADGQVVAFLDQYGYAGIPSLNNTFRFGIPDGVPANNSLVLRASVKGGGGTDSKGTVILLSDGDPPIRLLCIGDSITEGTATRPDGDGNWSWRYWCWQNFVDFATQHEFVGTRTASQGGSSVYPGYGGRSFPNRHEAIWGTTLAERSASAPTYLGTLKARGQTPDLAVISGGGNDIPLDLSVSAATVRDRAKAVIDSLQGDVGTAGNPNIRIVLISILPRFSGATPDPRNDRYAETNALLAHLATTETTATSAVTYLDVWPFFLDSAMFYDGIHPNGRGEQLLGNAVFASLVPDMPPVQLRIDLIDPVARTLKMSVRTHGPRVARIVGSPDLSPGSWVELVAPVLNPGEWSEIPPVTVPALPPRWFFRAECP